MSLDHEKNGAVTLPAELVGTFRRIGNAGPVYEILGQHTQNGEALARILVIKSGEETDYPIDELLEDPVAS